MDPYLIVAGDLVENRGMDRANLELARYLVELGHPVDVVAHEVSPRLARLRGVRFHRAPRLQFGILAERALNHIGHRVAASLPQNARIVVNGGNCDLVGVNWVHFVHGANSTEHPTMRHGLQSAVAKWSERRAIAKAKLILANSDRTRRDLIRCLRVPEDLVKTVYCGVDPEKVFPVDALGRAALATRLGFSPQVRRLVFVGALGDDRKGFSVVFDVWRQIAQSWTDFELIVVGVGQTLRAWRTAAKRAHLGERLHFLGHRDDVPEILKSSELLVAPAKYEPYGLNIAEAISCGLPVIASRESGACERIGGELTALLLSDPSSSVELLAKLSLWRDSVERYRQAALAESENFRRHSWEAMSWRIHEMIEDSYT